MAETVKRKPEDEFISPKGKAKWAKLNKPDTKFNPLGTYSVELVLDPQDTETIKFVAQIEAAHEAGFQAAQKADPKKKFTKQAVKIKPETNKDGEPTGMTIVSFACKASGVRKKDNSTWTYRPRLFDSSRPNPKPLPNDLVIFGGSIIKVCYSIRHTPMPTGLFYSSLNLKAVKVLDLKSASSREASEYGFEDEEGFEVESTENTESFEKASVNGGDDF